MIFVHIETMWSKYKKRERKKQNKNKYTSAPPRESDCSSQLCDFAVVELYMQKLKKQQKRKEIILVRRVSS